MIFFAEVRADSDFAHAFNRGGRKGALRYRNPYNLSLYGEANCGVRVPPRLHQDIQDLTILIDGAI